MRSDPCAELATRTEIFTMRWLSALPILLLVLGVSHAADPANPDVYMPDGTTRVVFDPEGKNQVPKGKNHDVRVAYEGYLPLRQPGGDKESGAAKLKFLQRVQTIGEFQQPVVAGRGNFYAIASYPGNVPLGWVPDYAVIFGNECLNDPQSGIQIKAMVVNSLSHLTDKNIPAKLKEAPPPIHLGPTDAVRNIGAFRFFDFYFVWADTDRDHPDRGYALLGDMNSFPANLAPGISDERFPEWSKIRGWVKKSRLCFWRTREAIQWNDKNLNRTEPVRAYATIDFAKADLNKKLLANAVEQPAVVIEEFDNDKKPVRWEPWRMRYPVLLTKGIKEEKDWSSKLFTRTDGATNRLFNVGVIGDVFGDDGKMIFKRKDKAAINKGLDDVMEQINTLQILFVIDRTDSMQKKWVYTAESVQRLTEQVRREGRSVSLAFCYYADVWVNGQEGKITDFEEAIKKGGVFPGQFFDAADEKLLKAKLEELRDEKQVKEGGGRLEMVYAGLEAGLLTCGAWKAKARKMVILIGDDGNHVFEATVEKATQERIATFCARGGTKLPPKKDEETRTPIEFYALHVDDIPRDATADHPRRLFKTQTEAIRDLINDKTGPGTWFKLTKRSLDALQGEAMPDAVLAKLNGLKDKEFRRDDFEKELTKVLSADEKNKYLVGIIKQAGVRRAEYFNPSSSQTEIQNTIKSRYDHLEAAADEIRKDLEKVKSGQVRTRFDLKNPDSLAIITELAALHNTNNADAIFEGSQVFEPRYVWLKGPQTGEKLNDRQIRSMVLVSDGELKKVLSILENFFEPENPPSLEKVAKALIEIHSGAIKDPKELEAFLALPINKQLDRVKVNGGFEFAGKLSQFLGYAKDDDKDPNKKDVKPRQPTQQEKDQLLLEMRRRYYKLKGIRKDEVYVEKGNDKWELATPTDYEPRGFTKGFDPRNKPTSDPGKKTDDTKPGIWYWIDVDEEWL